MINRIVKTTFQLEQVETFETLFNQVKDKISDFPGCHGVDLLQDKTDARIFFTYSFWESDDDLQAYRQSELFQSTWAKTKVLFDDKPLAWSTTKKNSARS